MNVRAWLQYKLAKKLRKRYARVASAVIRGAGRCGWPLAPVVMSHYGVRMRANWSDRTFQYCHFATYGRFLADYLRQQADDFVFLDIGANQGLYSLIAAQNPHCTAALALEPVAATFALLEANIAANGAGARVRALRAALAERDGEARISVQASHSGTATLASGSNFDPRHVQTITLVGIGSLDREIPAGPGIVVKVDVEGYENVVLGELLRSAHAPRIRAVFYEVDNRWSEATALRERLAAAGFTRFTRHGLGRHYDMLAERQVQPAAAGGAAR